MTDKESDTGKFFTNYRFEYPKENVVVATSSFQEVPSNKKPLINLTVNGILRPSEEKVHEIKMIFDTDIPEKDNLSQSYGTFVLCKGVYNARKIVKTAWDKEKSTLTVIIDLSREKIRPKRPAQFSFSIQINDTAAVPKCKDVPEKSWVIGNFKTKTFQADTVNGSCPYGQTLPSAGLCLGTCTTCQKYLSDCKNNTSCCEGNCKIITGKSIGYCGRIEK